MLSFKITEREIRTIKRNAKMNLRERMANVIVVEDGVALLEQATQILKAATHTDTYAVLLASLSLVSGRRLIEVLNACTGRSSFEKRGERSVLFAGQAKTKHTEGGVPYVIPLICDADDFLHGIACLMRKRGDLDLTNDEIHIKMNGIFLPENLQRVFPMLVGLRWHLLRSFYVAFVNHCYTHTLAFNHLAKCVLGHQDETESLAYVSTRIDGIEALKGSFGPKVGPVYAMEIQWVEGLIESPDGIARQLPERHVFSSAVYVTRDGVARRRFFNP
eukprot:769963-Prymnesium_polylepis.1